MAFFKFRNAADEPASQPAQPQSIEAMRKRAKYRLAGATLLVLVGVIGLPLLFDKQPRPIAVDTPIDIPDRNKVLPLTLPAAAASAPIQAASVAAQPEQAKSDTAKSAPAAVASEAGVITEIEDKKTAVAPVHKASVATKNVVKESANTPKPAANNAAVKSAEAAKVQALLEGGAVSSPAASSGRFVVQVGAFADAALAHEARLKLERAGLKTYTHVAETKDGKRIRVRVGPFSVKADAEKAVEKVKKLNLPAALLTL
ncbi:MAG: hypothetical protein FD135_4873 [Comamonadaceae bacterium]|nr:MAG: hypothetical protein FD135_4873 [Comamonadaceae bacterium]